MSDQQHLRRTDGPPCPACRGVGLVKDHSEWPFPGEKRCPECDGTGIGDPTPYQPEEADRV